MRKGFFTLVLVVAVAWLCRATDTNLNRYEIRRASDPNGIDKFYMGRQIARVMGHEGADWLERPEREKEERD